MAQSYYSESAVDDPDKPNIAAAYEEQTTLKYRT